MTRQAIEVDGSQGEGGGQILRSSLGLSLLTGTPLRLVRIRAGRSKPGLQPQHLMAVEAAAKVGRAELTGAELGSQELEFHPAEVTGGEYEFRIRTAGSATLVLQTILPALMLAKQTSRVTVSGGTHNPFAPPVDFLQQVYLPLVNRLGPQIDLQLEQYGFYPAGGGRIVAQIRPTQRLQGFDLLERGALENRLVRALVSRLPLQIARREVDAALAQLGWPASCGRAEEVGSNGPGNVVMATIETAECAELVSEFGKRGVPAEQVAKKLARAAAAYLEHDAPVGEHLADQWLLPLGLAVWQTGRSQVFRARPLSLHAITHMEILKRFLGVEALVEPESERGTCRVELRCV